MAVPEILGVSLTSPYFIVGVVVVIAIVGGVIWWLKKEGKI